MSSMYYCVLAAETSADCHMHLMHELLLIFKCIYLAGGIIYYSLWAFGLQA